MIGRGHHDLTAEAPNRVEDPLIIRRNQHLGERGCLARTLVDVLDHRPTGNVCQRLTGQSGCLPARGNDTYRPHQLSISDGTLPLPSACPPAIASSSRVVERPGMNGRIVTSPPSSRTICASGRSSAWE